MRFAQGAASRVHLPGACCRHFAASPVAANSLVLSFPEFQAFDLERERNPEHAIALAEERLHGAGAARDALSRAYLHLIVAFSRGDEGRAIQRTPTSKVRGDR